MPNQKIRELRAIGKAYAESDPDNAQGDHGPARLDSGDTLIARVDSIAPTATTRPPVKTSWRPASGEASAFYQVRVTDPSVEPVMQLCHRGA
jgi:hypothetical protein